MCHSLVLEVYHDEQLGEEDYVDEVGAHGPEAVDGRDGEGHGCRHRSHDKDGRAHHPQDLGFGCLRNLMLLQIRVDRLLRFSYPWSEEELVNVPGEHGGSREHRAVRRAHDGRGDGAEAEEGDVGWGKVL